MLTVKGTTITLNRCDTVSITVTVRDSTGGVYELRDGDVLYFAAKKNAKDADYAIAPIALDGNTLNLDSEDTEQLEFGDYLYDIRLITSSGKTSTIIEPSRLTIKESITGIGDR